MKMTKMEKRAADQIDFYSIYQEAMTEYENEIGHSIDNDDYPDYILYAMKKVYILTKNNELD